MREGWGINLLKNVTVFKSGKTVSKDIEKGIGRILYLKVGDMNLKGNEKYITTSSRFVEFIDINENQIIPIGSIIFPKRGGAIATNKKRKIVSPTIVDLNIMAIGPSNKLYSEYLFYWLKSIDLRDFSNGTSIPQINNNSFDNLFIPFPNSLSEQKQIVEILDEAFIAIDQATANIEKNIQNAKELFQSKLNDIFSRKGEGWEEKLLPELVDKSCSLSYGIVQPGDEFQDGIPVVRPTDMKEIFVNLDDLKRINPTKADSYKRTTLTGRELLLCVRGNTGIVSLTSKVLKGANVTRGIVPILFDENLLRLNFGYYQFFSGVLHKQIKEKTYGAALMQINIRDVKRLKLNVPPIKVQDELLPVLNKLSENTESLLLLYSNKITSLEELKKSILQKAFAGELTNNMAEV